MSNPLDVLYDSLQTVKYSAYTKDLNLIVAHADLIADVIRAAERVVETRDGLCEVSPDRLDQLTDYLDALKAALKEQP